MPKTCIGHGCDRPQFGGQRCSYHQYKRKMRGGDLYKPAKAKKPIPKESKKRKKEHIRYLDQLKMFKQELRDKGEYFCFITGEPFGDTVGNLPTCHHLRGRVGDYYLDKEWWIMAKNQAHLDVFHNEKTIDYLIQQPWWDAFLARLRDKDELSYQKIMRRIDKADELF